MSNLIRPRWWGVLVVAVALAGCGRGNAREGVVEAVQISDRPVRVVTTTNFVTDLVREVGGDRVEVYGLMGAGVDPHLYKASAGDVGRLEAADLIVQVGLHLEARLGEVLHRLGASRTVVAVGDSLDSTRLIRLTAEERGGGAEYDPHIWFDTDLWAGTPTVVAEALGRLDTLHAEAYRARARAYADRIRAAGVAAAEQLAAIPQERRVLVTSHDAFRYFSRRFAVDVEPIQGISTVAEATTADVDRVAALIAARGVRAVFIESSVPRQTIDAVMAAARRRGATVALGGELFGDAAGDAGTPSGTYLGMLAHNVMVIAQGLR